MCSTNQYSKIINTVLIQSITLAVSNLWAVFGKGNKDPEEFSLTLDGFWTLSHQRAVSWERTL